MSTVTDFPTGLRADGKKQKPDAPKKMTIRARKLLYYLGRYSKYNKKEDWHYVYFNNLPEDGRSIEDIAKNYLKCSRNTAYAAYKDLTDLGYLKKNADHYRLYNCATIWRNIPNNKLDSAFEYSLRHGGEVFIFEVYCALIWKYNKKGRSEGLSANQILQLYGHDTKTTLREKVIDIIDHLNGNGYCAISARKIKRGGLEYYEYFIRDSMANYTPIYRGRLADNSSIIEGMQFPGVIDEDTGEVIEGN